MSPSSCRKRSRGVVNSAMSKPPFPSFEGAYPRSWTRNALAPVGRLVPPVDRRADCEELQALLPRDQGTRGLGVDADETARAEFDFLAVDPHRPGAVDDEIDLLL